jgi:CheY-like chemotaxis protein
MPEKQETLLLAGENPIDLDRLSIHLHNEGFRTPTVADRKMIVDLARSEVPNLIMLDFDYCFDICCLLKRNFVTEVIPIIALLFPANEPDRVAVALYLNRRLWPFTALNQGRTVDFLLSKRRDVATAKRFFSQAAKQHGSPEGDHLGWLRCLASGGR